MPSILPNCRFLPPDNYPFQRWLCSSLLLMLCFALLSSPALANAEVIQIGVVNASTDAFVAKARVDLMRRGDNGKARRIGRKRTTANGRVTFVVRNFDVDASYFAIVKAYGGIVESQPIAPTVDNLIEVGRVAVAVRECQSDLPYVDKWVTAYQRSAQGEHTRWKAFKTDKEGRVYLDPPGLGNGSDYVFSVKDPAGTGVEIFSDTVNKPGEVVLCALSAQELRVTVVNRFTSDAVTNARVSAFINRPGSTPKKVAAGSTDGDGQLTLQLKGLGAGQTFHLRVRAYPGRVFSAEISESGDVSVEVGTVAVAVRNCVTGEVFARKAVRSFELSGEGERQDWRRNRSDANGVAYFDPPKLDQGVRYVFAVKDPNGSGQFIYSRAVSESGLVEICVGDDVVDEEAPQLSIVKPAQDELVTSAALQVEISARDNVGVERVEVALDSAAPVVADFSADAELWRAEIVPPAGHTGLLRLTVKAFDAAGNRQESTVDVRVVGLDEEPPRLTILRPTDGATVPDSGFTIGGTAADNVVVASVVVDVDGHELLEASIDGDSGTWSAVLAGDLPAGSPLALTVRVTDEAGNQTERTVTVTVVVPDLDQLSRHLLDRITYGPTPDLLERAKSTDFATLLAQQLDPACRHGAELDRLLAEHIGRPVDSKSELQTYALLRAIFSDCQLREIMTQFWDNHFNTNINKSDNAVVYEFAERESFGRNAMGNFRDLLDVSAKSPAMLYYLDGVDNVAGEPNENYSRELMELHTMGVDGGFTQQDVEEVARAFTGWTVRDGAFFFDAGQHDNETKTVLGSTLPGGGIEDGLVVLDLLSQHVSTARFICGKLVALLVTDTRPASLVARCAETFQQTADAPDQITQVLSTILNSTEFADPAVFRAKVKTPMELAVGYMRQFSTEGNFDDLRVSLRDMGMRLFEYPVPTGFAEAGDDWISSNALMERFKFVADIAFDTPSSGHIYIDHLSLYRDRGLASAEQVIDYVMELAMAGDYTLAEWDEAYAILTDDGAVEFDISMAGAEYRLRRLLSVVLNFPGYHHQ